MPEQSDFPEVWSCESENKDVRVEIAFPNQDFFASGEDVDPYDWIEIPTTNVEMWVEKGGSARIQRTAKVEFPSEWGRNIDTVRHNSPRRLLERFEPTGSNSFQFCRIWFRDDIGNWVVTHLGWIGGIGPSDNTNEHKFWVYDFAELLQYVRIGERFNRPDIETAASILARLTNNNTNIPLGSVRIVPPDAERAFVKQTDGIAVSTESLVEGISRVNEAESNSTLYNAAGEATVPVDDDGAFGDVVIVDTESSGTLGSIFSNTRSFTPNRHTLQDVYDWFEKKTGSNLWFLPTPNAVVLVVDVTPSRRTYLHDAVASQAILEQGTPFGELPDFHEIVEVYRNTALYEARPVNSVTVNGSTGGDIIAGISDAVTSLTQEGASNPGQYPTATATVPSLVDAAEGNILEPPIIESDADTIEQVEKVAIKEMVAQLEEAGEGSILLQGVPRMQPFDEVVAFEVCYGEVEYEQTPVKYEVESVKHQKSARDVFKTSINASIWANETHIEVESEWVDA